MPFLPTRGLHKSANGQNITKCDSLTSFDHQTYQEFILKAKSSLTMSKFNIVKFTETGF